MTKMINVDELIEFCNTSRSMLGAHNRSVACAALRGVVEYAKEYAVEAEPVKQDTELSNILQDYGIIDADTLRYILDQYQKIIVDITGGQMSYLTYPAETVIACADDNYSKCHEESMKHGRWIYPYPDRDICRCSNCGFNVQDKISNVPEMFLACPRCFARMDGDSE